MTKFTYDCRNRLIKAGNTTYEYDAENTRIALETPEYREEYVVNTNTTYSQVLEATRMYKGADTEDAAVTTYTYGNGLISQYEKETGTAYYHYDNLGSTTYLTKDGIKTAQFAYGTYGELILGDVGEVRFLYNGRFGVITDENNLYYMRARYYNVDIKRFINQDIITGDISNSQSLNRYAYCQGNPVNYMDPFGLSPQDTISTVFHTVLNALGMLPCGEVFDIINAVWYTIEGNSTEAMICLIGGLPFLGNFAGAFNLTKLAKGLRFGANLGKIYIGGKGAIGNLNAMWEMQHNGKGRWYDYLREGGLFLLNAVTIASGAVAVVDGLNDLARQIRSLCNGKIAEAISVARAQFNAFLANNSGKVDLSAFWKKSGSGSLGAEPYTIYRADGGVITDVAGLPGAKGMRVENRLSTENMRYLTQEYGVEFALVYQYGNGKNGGGGSYWLYSGIENKVSVPVNKDSMLIYHTHPEGYYATPSVDDYNLMKALKASGSTQRVSTIVPVNKNFIVKFNTKTYQKIIE